MNIECPYCGAVNSVRPGMATTYYYSGNAIHALAEEGALDQWRAVREAERHFSEHTEHSKADKAQLRAAFETYWRRYSTIHGELHPDWTPEQVEREVTAKVAQSMAGYDNY
jgi:hypothetical protein